MESGPLVGKSRARPRRYRKAGLRGGNPEVSGVGLRVLRVDCVLGDSPRCVHRVKEKTLTLTLSQGERGWGWPGSGAGEGRRFAVPRLGWR